MSKSIGIITVHNSPNYGSTLQSFALYRYLSLQGHDCQIIDLARPTHDDYIISNNYPQLYNISKNSSTLKFIKTIKNAIIKKLSAKKEPSQLMQKKRISRARFNEFNSQIHLSKRYRCIDDLYENPPEYEIYITGSDQVWNPTIGFPIEPYFLTFIKNNGRRVSYGASIGLSNLPAVLEPLYKHWLSDYDFISVRETEAEKILSKLTDKKIEVVLDPIYLLDKSYWDSIMILPDIKKKYIFCFILNRNDDLLKYACQIKNESGLELYVISQNSKDAYNNYYYYSVDAGPKEYLGLISNAELVLTDSFHATAFSILLAKNFFSYIKPNTTFEARGSRLINLLNLFSLSDHMLDTGLSMSGRALLNNVPDRIKLNKKIFEERDSSRLFINNALS